VGQDSLQIKHFQNHCRDTRAQALKVEDNSALGFKRNGFFVSLEADFIILSINTDARAAWRDSGLEPQEASYKGDKSFSSFACRVSTSLPRSI
jgi:hypothetical protein